MTGAHFRQAAHAPSTGGWRFEPSSPSSVSGALCVMSLLVVSFYAGFRPEVLAYGLGWAVLLASLIFPPIYTIALRLEDVTWGTAITIVSAIMLVIIMFVFIPSWYFFTYLPEQDVTLLTTLL